MNEQDSAQSVIQKRFAELPETVQQAITDASVEKKLRTLAEKHKLHLDQWVLLENEIMFTLLGMEEPENMAKNIASEVNIDSETAQELVNDIALQVFKPIREQMQEALNQDALERDTRTVTTQGKKAPSDTSAYQHGQSSTERRDVQEDPYRESIE